jgi:hypothetical protein
VLILGNDGYGLGRNGFAHLPLEAGAGELKDAVVDLLTPASP